MSKINGGLMSSLTPEWGTPQAFFDELDAEFGFTLDVCADGWNHKCDRFFTKRDDGLAQVWSGVCWMNPPYGREIGAWMAKAVDAWRGGLRLCVWFRRGRILRGGMIMRCRVRLGFCGVD
jgi:phage N-6-adenine-methyltransferase